MDQSNIALPVAWYKNHESNKMSSKPYCQFTFPDYANGGLRTSASDLALHLSMVMQYGVTGSGKRLLKESTVREIRRKQLSGKLAEVGKPKELLREQALLMYYETVGKRSLLGHEGGEKGVANLYFFHPETNVGVVILTNADWEQTKDFDETLYGIENYLFDVFEGHLFETGRIKVNPSVYKADPSVPVASLIPSKPPRKRDDDSDDDSDDFLENDEDHLTGKSYSEDLTQPSVAPQCDKCQDLCEYFDSSSSLFSSPSTLLIAMNLLTYLYFM